MAYNASQFEFKVVVVDFDCETWLNVHRMCKSVRSVLQSTISNMMKRQLRNPILVVFLRSGLLICVYLLGYCTR